MLVPAHSIDSLPQRWWGRLISRSDLDHERRLVRSGTPMSSIERYAAFLFSLFLLATMTRAQGLPNYVVDAQMPIPSSDGLQNPQAVAVGPGRTAYVVDKGTHRVLEFAADGTQTTVDFGTLAPAVNSPQGVAVDGAGNLYVTDVETNRLIKVSPGASKGLAVISGAILDQPISVASDAAGNLAIANAGNKTVVVRRYAGTPAVFNTGSTVLNAPTAVAFDNVGMLYVADAGNGITPPAVYRFPKLGGTGTNITPVGYPLMQMTGLALDDQRNLYVLDGASKQLIEAPVSGAAAFLIPESNFQTPSGLGIDTLGNLYVSDGTGNSLTKLIYNNAADFGALQVGATSKAVLFNFEFYSPTTIEATRGIGGGVWNSEYKKAAGGTCGLRTYYPSTSTTGLTLPATCTAALSFTPLYPGGRQGAIQLQTSVGNINQLTLGTGLGGQLALLNAVVTPKLGSTDVYGSLLLDGPGANLYFTANGGTYKVPAVGGTPTLVTSHSAFAMNGVGDLFAFDPPTITKIPADGSPNVEIHVTGLVTPQGIAMDSNGAFYITDWGVNPEYNAAGFVVRVSPTGVTTKTSPTGYWAFPSGASSDGQGNIYITDGGYRNIYKIAGWTGDYTQLPTSGPEISGSQGAGPGDIAVDASGTFYYWDNFLNGNFEGFAYAPPSGQHGAFFIPGPPESQVPLYTIPFMIDYNGPGSFYAFFIAGGNHTLASSPNTKLYAANGMGSGIFVVDRTQGNIPYQAFVSSEDSWFFGPTQNFFVYNVGNQNMTFTDPTKTFTETGNGVGSFSFSTPPPSTTIPRGAMPCVPGAVIAPGDYCQINVTNNNGQIKGPIVTDTLHFLTDAVNNDAVAFRINGVGNPAPK
jgi:sugar lactone lactonase YvrE